MQFAERVAAPYRLLDLYTGRSEPISEATRGATRVPHPIVERYCFWIAGVRPIPTGATWTRNSLQMMTNYNDLFALKAAERRVRGEALGLASTSRRHTIGQD